MSVQVGPHTRFAAALVAAGVVSAAAVVALPEPRALPTVSADVADASVITDALASLGKGVQVLSSLVGIHVDATVSLPFEATLAVMAAAQHPELGPNVLSYLVQRFVNPSVGPPVTAYPWLTEQTAALVATLLPSPLGPSATDPGSVDEARLAFAAAFDSVLGKLPDLMPGFGAVRGAMNDSMLGGAVVAGQLVVRAPLYMAWNTVNYLGNLPVNVEASIESAIAAPQRIPGLVSNLVYGLLSPDANVGLFGQLLDNAVDPLTWLPAPIGYGSDAAVGLANQVRAAIVGVMNTVLSLLPAPVTPSALPVATATRARPTYAVDAGKGSVAPGALPSASLALADAVSLAPVKKVDETALKTRGPVTPSTDDVAPAAPPVTGVEPTGAADESDEADVDAKVRPRRDEPRHGETIKDLVTRPTTEDGQTKPAATETHDAGTSGVPADSGAGAASDPSGAAA